MKKYITLFIIALMATNYSFAQNDRTEGAIKSELKGLEYEIKAGLNIGGASPIPLPREIREINSYNPTFAGSIEGVVTKWFDHSNWGISLGLKLENKNMITRARVKNYGMEIIDDGQRIDGRFTGNVKTTLRNSYLTLPLLANLKISERVKLSAGAFVSYLIDGEFSGNVSEGYLRQGSPVGEKIGFKGDNIATYDFSNDLSKFQYGLQVGASWKAFKRLRVFGDLSLGLKDIFKKDFKTITFTMYPIYLNAGFGYAF